MRPDLPSRIRLNWDWETFWRGFGAVVGAGLLMLAVPGVRPDRADPAFEALGLARDHLFDFANWEAAALFDKTAVGLVGAQNYMTEVERSQYVRDYIQLIYDIHQLEQQIETIYSDPAVDDPESASADLRAQRDALRVVQQERQALAEAIVQEQISAVLADYGFGVGGQIIPPVEIRFTQLPTIMIISPRDHIERIGSYPLEHGLEVEQMVSIETSVEQDLGVSAIIEPLGGLGVYPAMLVETGYLPHVMEIGAHEWAHHYLSFFALGFSYGASPELFTMNETTASIIGREIGWAVLNRYYPDLAGPPPDWSPPPPAPEAPAEPPAFDFQAEMHETRVRVDELLAAGQIDEAERYMEERRQIFVANGYRIRRLNQAYFAFHGAYADEPGATGTDPIGPALLELRTLSPSLHDFVVRVRGMTSYADLISALEAAR